jgi:hypothetical protein
MTQSSLSGSMTFSGDVSPARELVAQPFCHRHIKSPSSSSTAFWPPMIQKLPKQLNDLLPTGDPNTYPADHWANIQSKPDRLSADHTTAC